MYWTELEQSTKTFAKLLVKLASKTLNVVEDNITQFWYVIGELIDGVGVIDW